MGLLDGLLGNASTVDIGQVKKELAVDFNGKRRSRSSF